MTKCSNFLYEFGAGVLGKGKFPEARLQQQRSPEACDNSKGLDYSGRRCMALISAFTLIRAISLFHLTAAFFFLTAPRTIADQNVVFMLGESMRLPHVTSMDKASEASAFIAVLLAFTGLSDLTAASLNEYVSLEYWLSIVPVRLLFFFGLTSYVYLFKEDGVFGSGSTRQAGAGELLQNSMVFSFGFFEISIWFWIFTSLREERRQMAQRRLEKLKAEQDSL